MDNREDEVLPKYESRDHNRFVKDMRAAGLRLRHYNGRWFWSGPAVSVDRVQDAQKATKVRCQWDQLGMGYIVYPVTRGAVLA